MYFKILKEVEKPKKVNFDISFIDYKPRITANLIDFTIIVAFLYFLKLSEYTTDIIQNIFYVITSSLKYEKVAKFIQKSHTHDLNYVILQNIVTLALITLYRAIFSVSKMYGTIGKYIMKIRLFNSNGSPVSIGSSFAREFLISLFILPFFILFEFVMYFNESQQNIVKIWWLEIGLFVCIDIAIIMLFAYSVKKNSEHASVIDLITNTRVISMQRKQPSSYKKNSVT